MKVVSFSSRDTRKMPMLQISRKIVNTEAKLYLYSHKDKWYHLSEILKVYFNDDADYLNGKMYVIEQLLENMEELDMPELVLPSAMASIDGNLCGFLMPFVENNVNMSLLLNNPKVRLEQKIAYLKEIYSLLDKTLKIKALEDNFFLGDIHEANFLLDIDSQRIKAIDLDSSYIMGSQISDSKYLSYNGLLLENPLKYPHTKDGRVIPNKNTTMLCFVYMLLNALSNDTLSYCWDLKEFYGYICFLEKMGCSIELLDCIINIYNKSLTNEFPIEILDSIDTSKDYSLHRARIVNSNGGFYREISL